MSRQRYLGFTLLYCLFGFIVAAGLRAQSERPNVIFILTDDQHFVAIGYVGNELATTPEMDELADLAASYPEIVETLRKKIENN